MKKRTVTFLSLCLMVLVAGMVMFTTPAYGQVGGFGGLLGGGAGLGGSGSGQMSSNDTCTNFADAANNMNNSNGGGNGSGLLSDIYKFIKDVVGNATQKLFSAFTDSGAYQNAVGAAFVLMVVFYGVGFTIGVVQASFGQVLVRLIKISIIGALVSPGGWWFFSDYVVTFFSDGTDDIIRTVMSIGTGTAAGATPFSQLDNIAGFLLQPQTLIAIIGSLFAGGPFALAMGGLMTLAMWSFFKMIVGALQTYAVTYVARALILSVAPIFLVFLLFERTKNLFMAWVNALVSLSLRPILLFTFLSFFLVMIQSAATDMLGVELCWTNFSSSVQGTTNKPSFWRFKDKQTGELMTSQLTWQGPLECLFTGSTSQSGGCKSFPINILDILTFLILVYLAQRFTGVIDQIASEISGAVVPLDGGSSLNQYLQQQNNKAAAAVKPSNSNAGGARR